MFDLSFDRLDSDYGFFRVFECAYTQIIHESCRQQCAIWPPGAVPAALWQFRLRGRTFALVGVSLTSRVSKKRWASPASPARARKKKGRVRWYKTAEMRSYGYHFGLFFITSTRMRAFVVSLLSFSYTTLIYLQCQIKTACIIFQVEKLITV